LGESALRPRAGRGTGRGSGAKAAAGRTSRRGTPPRLDMTIDGAKRLAPQVPHSTLWLDVGAARVRAFYKAGGSRCSHSCNVQRWGEEAAVRETLRWLWTTHCAVTGEACPHEGLFDGS